MPIYRNYNVFQIFIDIFIHFSGHWLQKATEHMIGCVMCSPGCFSLFRAKALMDDNVMRRYTTKSEDPMHFVQYDQVRFFSIQFTLDLVTNLVFYKTVTKLLWLVNGDVSYWGFFRFKHKIDFNKYFKVPLILRYSKVASSNMTCLEAQAGLFRLLMKGISGPYVLCDLLIKSWFFNQ